MVSLGINIILSLILVWPLAHAGLALSTSLSSWVNVIALWMVLNRRGISSVNLANWGKFLSQLLFANSLLAVFLWFASGDIMIWINWTWDQRLLHILLLGIGSCMIYIFSLWVTGSFPKKSILISQTI